MSETRRVTRSSLPVAEDEVQEIATSGGKSKSASRSARSSERKRTEVSDVGQESPRARSSTKRTTRSTVSADEPQSSKTQSHGRKSSVEQTLKKTTRSSQSLGGTSVEDSKTTRRKSTVAAEPATRKRQREEPEKAHKSTSGSSKNIEPMEKQQGEEVDDDLEVLEVPQSSSSKKKESSVTKTTKSSQGGRFLERDQVSRKDSKTRVGTSEVTPVKPPMRKPSKRQRDEPEEARKTPNRPSGPSKNIEPMEKQQGEEVDDDLEVLEVLQTSNSKKKESERDQDMQVSRKDSKTRVGTPEVTPVKSTMRKPSKRQRDEPEEKAPKSPNTQSKNLPKNVAPQVEDGDDDVEVVEDERLHGNQDSKQKGKPKSEKKKETNKGKSKATATEMSDDPQIRKRQCDQCFKILGDTASLRNHMKVHGPETAAECPECNLPLKYKYNLKNHMKHCKGAQVAQTITDDELLRKHYPQFMQQLDAASKDPSLGIPSLKSTPFTMDKYGCLIGFDNNLDIQLDQLIPNFNPDYLPKNMLRDNISDEDLGQLPVGPVNIPERNYEADYDANYDYDEDDDDDEDDEAAPVYRFSDSDDDGLDELDDTEAAVSDVDNEHVSADED